MFEYARLDLRRDVARMRRAFGVIRGLLLYWGCWKGSRSVRRRRPGTRAFAASHALLSRKMKCFGLLAIILINFALMSVVQQKPKPRVLEISHRQAP